MEVENDVFTIQVPVEFFDRALADKVDLRVNYYDPLLGEVIVELSKDFTLDYYTKFFLNIVSNNDDIEESYKIPIGIERVENGLKLLSVEEFFEKQAAEKTESFFYELEIDGKTEEVLVVSFSKEIIIKALINEENMTMQLDSFNQIVIDQFKMQEILSKPVN